MSNFLFTDTINGKTIRSFPGAYVFRGLYSSSINSMVPIYNSIPSFPASVGILNDSDSAVIVLPGFTLNLYATDNYTSTVYSYDNSGGTDVLYRISTGANTASSCKLFYKFPSGNVEL
jgi:hypothetical protein